MYFSLEYENGFVVTLTQIWEDGYLVLNFKGYR